MWTYILRRALQSIPVILGVALISFVLSELSGNAIRGTLGQSASPEAIARVTKLYGYDQPRHVRFINYMNRLAHGDFGVSIVSQGQRVTDMLTSGMRVTIKL